MKIAIVLPRGGRFCAQRPNSMETVVRTLRAASRYRRTTTVICDAGGEAGDDGHVVTVPASLSRTARNAAVARVLQDLAPDQIEHHQHLKDSADIAGRVGGSNHVFYRHTAIKRPRNPLEGMRYRARLRRFSSLIFVSDAAKAAFLHDYPGFAAVAASVCNPVDPMLWRGTAEAKDRSILFAGRPTREKGFDLACQALEVVLKANPDWTADLLLAEFERHEAWAQACLDPLGRFGDRVRVVRSAPAAVVQAATAKAAIAVVPSRAPETLGLSAIEAHAAGAAVVSSGRGGLKEASGPHAVYVDPDRTDALCDALSGLIVDPARRISLARGGQAYAIANHAPARRAGQLDRLRDRLVYRPIEPVDHRPIPDEGTLEGLVGLAGF